MGGGATYGTHLVFRKEGELPVSRTVSSIFAGIVRKST